MMKYSNPEYQALEREFFAAPGALCENKNPLECDCKNCPCHDLCEQLCNF